MWFRTRREAQNEAATVLQHVGSWRQSLSVARIDVDLVEQSSKKLETATQNQEKLGNYVKVGRSCGVYVRRCTHRCRFPCIRLASD